MAEAVAAVGLVGSVISILDFSIKSFKAVGDYLNDAEKAPKWIQDAQADTSDVLSLLERIKTLDEGKFPPNAVASIAEKCKTKAERLDGILKGLMPPKTGPSNKARLFLVSVSLALKSQRDRRKLEEMSQILGEVKDLLNVELNRLNVALGQLNLEKQGEVLEVVENIQDHMIKSATDWTETRRWVGDTLKDLVMIHKSQASPGGPSLILTKHQDTLQISRGQGERILTDREMEQASVRRMLKSHCPPACPCKCHGIERQSADPQVGVWWRIAMFMCSVAIPCSYSACKYRRGNLDIRIPSNPVFNSMRLQLGLALARNSISPSMSVQPLIDGDPLTSPACRILHDIRRPDGALPREGWTAEITIRQLQKVFDERKSVPTERFPIYTSGDHTSRYLGSENLLSVAWYYLYPAGFADVPSEEVVKLMRFLIGQGCTMDTSPNIIGENCIFKWFYDVPEISVQDHLGVIRLLHDAGWELGSLVANIDSPEAKQLAGSLLNSHFMKLLCLSSHHCDGILGKSELFDAILRNDIGTAKLLLEKRTVDIDETIEFSGDTALHLAVMVQSAGLYNALGMINMLLTWSPDVNARNRKGLRPIEICAKYKLLETAIMLLEAGSSVADDKYLPSSFSVLGYTTDLGYTDGSKDFIQAVISWCLRHDKRAIIQGRLDQWLRYWIKQDDLNWCRIYLEAGANTDLRGFVWDFTVFSKCAELIREFNGVFRDDEDDGDQKEVEHAVQTVVRRHAASGDADGLLIRCLLDLAQAGNMERCLLYLEASLDVDFEDREEYFGPLSTLIRQNGGLLQLRDCEERTHLQNLLSKCLRHRVQHNHVGWCRLLLAAGADGDLSDLYWDYSISSPIVAIILDHGGRVKHLTDRNDKLRAAKAACSLSTGVPFSSRISYWQDQDDIEWCGIYEEVNAEHYPRDLRTFAMVYDEIAEHDRDALDTVRNANGWDRLRILLDWSIQYGYFHRITNSLLDRMSYYADLVLRFWGNASFLWRCRFYLEYCVTHIWRKDRKSEVPSVILRLLKERESLFRDGTEIVVGFVKEYGGGVHRLPDKESSKGDDSKKKQDEEEEEDDDSDEFFDC